MAAIYSSDAGHETRTRFRNAIADAGGKIDGFSGEAFMVTIYGDPETFLAKLGAAGWTRLHESGYLIPLMESKPANAFRHVGERPKWFTAEAAPAV